MQRAGHVEAVELAQRPGGRAGAVRHLDAEDVLADLLERAGYDGIDAGSGENVDRALSFVVVIGIAITTSGTDFRRWSTG